MFDIYIIHNQKLESRKLYLDSVLGAKPNVYYVSIENDCPDWITQTYEGLNEKKWVYKQKNLWDPQLQSRELTKGEIACTASHFYAYKKFLEISQNDWLLILEDDAILQPHALELLESDISSLPPLIDALFVGGAFPHDKVSLTVGKYLHFNIKHHPVTNGTISYLIHKKMIKKVMCDFNTFDLPIDYELAYLLMINNGMVLHRDPYVVEEGSKSIYTSSLASELDGYR